MVRRNSKVERKLPYVSAFRRSIGSQRHKFHHRAQGVRRVHMFQRSGAIHLVAATYGVGEDEFKNRLTAGADMLGVARLLRTPVRNMRGVWMRFLAKTFLVDLRRTTVHRGNWYFSLLVEVIPVLGPLLYLEGIFRLHGTGPQRSGKRAVASLLTTMQISTPRWTWSSTL